MLVLGLVDISWWVLLTLAITLYILYVCRDFNYFARRGVPHLKPWPIIGTSLGFLKKGLVQYHLDVQDQFGGDTVVGDFTYGSPSLLAFNADFLSQMMVKDFTSFTNRVSLAMRTGFGRHMVLALQDNHWKHVRNTMTPSFTSGKLKKMVREINRCARDLVENLSNATKDGGNVEAKQYTGAYTMDVIASTAFGMRVNSQRDPDNPFVKHAKAAFDINLRRLRFILPLFFPGFIKLIVALGFCYEIFGEEHIDFFSKVTRETMDRRQDEAHNMQKTDFIQLMFKAQRGEDIRDKTEHEEEEEQQEEPGKEQEDQEGDTLEGYAQAKGLSTDEIVANAMLFFIGGYDTTATSLQFFLYNMARYSKVQQRLVEEIETVIGDDAEVDYTKLSQMPYLDQCINENLRIYPPAVSINRKAGFDVSVENIPVRKGMTINIPIYAIHYDPKKWPDPECFDPERFSTENKKNRHPFHFLPFGHGPRNCIGMRLALLQMKVAIIYMLRAFKISSCEKTVYPLTFKASTLLVPNEDVVVKVEPR